MKESKLARRYFAEIEIQIKFAESAFSGFLEAIERGDSDMAFYHAHHMLIHTTNIGKIINFQSGSTREKVLGPHFQFKSGTIKKFRKLRNHLEHYDERLDKWVAEGKGDTFFDMNLVTGAKGFPHFAALRAIDGKSFFFQGEEYDLAELNESLKALKEIIDQKK